MVLALVEHEEGRLAETSQQALTLARDLADQEDAPLAAVVFEDDDEQVGFELASYGVTELYRVEHDRLDRYAPDARAATVHQLVDEHDPEAVVAPGSDRGHDVLGRAAARLGVPMAANCVEVTAGDGYEVTRHRWGGSLLEHARIDGSPALLSVAQHEVAAEEAEDGGSLTEHSFTPTLADSDLLVGIDRIEESDEEGVPLEEARVVVGGGRGVGGPEDYDKLEELADLLGGTVGASRAAVNEGWRPHDDQVGLTGAKISPDVYIACGISGAVQHMVGCKGAKNILAINTDPEAAIMENGEYAVVGDLHEVVPAITEAIREG
ncbi:electron transfer flavoprotein subunit alpha/FixB family protein [Halobacteriales archaeon QS_8_69_26]|nr:MAG: electron transfer flavoprotein subunit alpha/FixB family protein [Halobacteriales archaeon QS_8_69_26]